MKKFFLQAVVLIILTCFLISCQKNYEKISEIYTEIGNEEVLLTWKCTDGENSLFKVDIEPKPLNSNEGEYPCVPEYNYYLFCNLTNNQEYTITVENYDDKNGIISRKSSKVTPSENKVDYVYSKEKPYVEVPADRNFITLKNIEGKIITFANLNTGDKKVSAKEVRILGGKLARNRSLSEENCYEQQNELLRAETPAFLHQDYEHKIKTDSSRTAFPDVVKTPDEDTFDINNPEVGQVRKVYIDTDVKFFENSSVNYIEKKEITLSAIGRNNEGKIICLVWIEDSCFSDNECNGKKVNSTLAQKLAEVFVEYYLHERDIMGEESNKIKVLDDNYEVKRELTVSDLSEWSPTGEAVNLVLYDIGNDYEDRTGGKVTNMGYFAKKDNYTKAQETKYYYDENDLVTKTNCGKYLYLDTPTCNYSINEGIVSYNNEDCVPSGRIISTIIHEFQHMIHDNNNPYGIIWYNEMLSMLMEDVLYTDLNAKYGLTKKDGPFSRLKEFNKNYYYDWTDTNFEYECYAPTYAFGAWLIRNYGGVQLLKNLSISSKDGFDAIVDSVNNLNGLSGDEAVTKEVLLEQFLVSCAIYTENSEGTDLPTFNRISGESIESYGHTSALIPIDLFSEEFEWINSKGVTTKGPSYWANDYKGDIEPNTFIIKSGYKMGNDKQYSLLFSKSKRDNKNNKLFIFIQELY